LDFRYLATAVDFTLTGSGSAIYMNAPYAMLNISNTFTWSGSQCGISSTTFYAAEINLLPQCNTLIIGAGNNQFQTQVLINNRGYVEYRPTNNGVFLHTNGAWFNHPGAVFNVTGTSSVNYFVSDNVAQTFFINEVNNYQSLHRLKLQSGSLLCEYSFVNYLPHKCSTRQ
jgi:hypothetical protein